MGAIGDILRVIGILLLVVMVFNLLIIVHEWGHFLAARWRGLMVDRFQIWFGKPIWKKKINGVQYGLGSIPAGGFVSLPQMAPMGAIEGQAIDDEEGEDSEAKVEDDAPISPENLPPISPLDKIIVAFAGPLFSFLLAVVFACVVWIVGKPEAQMAQTKTVGYASPESPSAEAGFQPGDEIISVGGQEIARFHGLIDSVDWNYITSSETDVPVVINRPGTGEVTLTLKKDLEALEASEAVPQSWWKRTVSAIFSRSRLPDTGLRGAENPMIGQVSENGPAAIAGLQKNDVILKIDGIDVKSRFFITDYITEHPDKSLELEVRRGEEVISKTLTPRVGNIPEDWPEELREEYGKKRLVGIGWDEYGISSIAHPKPAEQVTSSLRVIVSTLKAVGQKGTGVNAGHLSGPVGIMRLYYRLFQHPDGWRLVLWFSVVLNINLAVLNMLPLPVLDGGHITMALIEWITRRPINFRVLEVVQTACVVLLLGFMGFVTLKDTGDLFRGGSSSTITFDAPAGAESAEPKE